MIFGFGVLVLAMLARVLVSSGEPTLCTGIDAIYLVLAVLAGFLPGVVLRLFLFG